MVAVKVLECYDESEAQALSAKLTQEAAILANLSHKNIVKFKGFSYSSTFLD